MESTKKEILRQLIEAKERGEEAPKMLRSLTVHIQGDFESGSFDAQVAQALVQLQQIVYRLAAKTLYGPDVTIAALSEEDLADFKLHFIVSKGSTNIEAGFWKQFNTLVETLTKDMTAGQKVFISGLIAACFLGYLASGSVEEYIRGQADIQMSQEETKRLDVLLRRVTHAGEESTGNFVKAAKGAESVSVGGRNYSRQDIADAQKRAPKQYITWEAVKDKFSVVALDCSKQDIIIATLVNPETQEKIKAYYTAESEEDEDAGLIRSSLANALATGRPVNLEIYVGRKGEHLEKATILNLAEGAPEGTSETAE